MPSALLDQSVLLSLLGGGFAAAFLHAALPNHWLPFVLVSRAQGWTQGRTLAVVAAAGLAHIASTALAGGLIVVAGLALERWIQGLLPYVSAAFLFLFGAFYLARAVLRRPATAGGPGVSGLDTTGPAVTDGAAALGLIAMLALSPGEVLLPFYLSSAAEGLPVLAALTLAFTLGTVGGMAVFTVLARAGASLLKLERWGRYEGGVLGVALIALGLLLVLRPH